MDGESWYGSGYSGSKDFSHWDVHTGKARGFGACEDNCAERRIDLNEQLVRNKPATFFLRVSGDAMINAGIFSGDMLIVDRSLKAANGKIIVAVLNGEMLIRRYEQSMNKLRLIPETAKLSPIDVSEFSDFKIWGVVVYVIRGV